MRNFVLRCVCALSVWSPSVVALTFDEAVSHSLETSYEVQRAHINLLSAKTDQLKAFAQMGPYGNFSYFDTTNNRTLSAEGINIQAPHAQQANATLGINLTAIAAGLIRIWSTGSSIALTREQEEQVKIQSAFMVARMYRLAQKAQMEVDVAKSRLEATKKQQKDAEIAYISGAISKSDRLEIDLLYDNAVIGVANAENERIKAHGTLVRVMGLDSHEPLVLDAMPALTPEMVPALPSMDDAVSQALLLRTDLSAAHSAVSAQSSARWLTLSPYLPIVSTEMSWQWNFGQLSDFVLPASQNFSLNLKWNFWDSGASYLDFRKVHLEMRRAQVNLREKAFDVWNEAEQSIRDLNLAKETLKLRLTGMEKAEVVYSGFQTRFSLGAVSVTDFLFAENTHHQAKSDLLSAIVGIDIAYMNMQQALGHKRPVPLGK